jgi:hypothetical protein
MLELNTNSGPCHTSVHGGGGLVAYFRHSSTLRRRVSEPAALNASQACLHRVRFA